MWFRCSILVYQKHLYGFVMYCCITYSYVFMQYLVITAFKHVRDNLARVIIIFNTCMVFYDVKHLCGLILKS